LVPLNVTFYPLIAFKEETESAEQPGDAQQPEDAVTIDTEVADADVERVDDEVKKTEGDEELNQLTDGDELQQDDTDTAAADADKGVFCSLITFDCNASLKTSCISIASIANTYYG